MAILGTFGGFAMKNVRFSAIFGGLCMGFAVFV